MNIYIQGPRRAWSLFATGSFLFLLVFPEPSSFPKPDSHHYIINRYCSLRLVRFGGRGRRVLFRPTQSRSNFPAITTLPSRGPPLSPLCFCEFSLIILSCPVNVSAYSLHFLAWRSRSFPRGLSPRARRSGWFLLLFLVLTVPGRFLLFGTAASPYVSLPVSRLAESEGLVGSRFVDAIVLLSHPPLIR